MHTDEEAIRQLMAAWRRAALDDDLEALLGLMTADAIFLTPGKPPMTRDDFAASFRELSGRVRLDFEQEVREIHAAGDVAYAWTRIDVATTEVDTGARSRRSGDVLTVFRKSPRYGWLLARDANLLPPAVHRKSASSLGQGADTAPSELEPEAAVVAGLGLAGWASPPSRPQYCF